MATKEVIYANICYRTDTEDNWRATNPILEDGEPGYVSSGFNKGKYKLGNGVSRWDELDFAVRDGKASSIEIGQAYNVETDQEVRVENTGDHLNAVLNFYLKQGKAATIEVVEVNTVPASNNAEIFNIGNETDVKLIINIPRGESGLIVPDISGLSETENMALDDYIYVYNEEEERHQKIKAENIVFPSLSRIANLQNNNLQWRGDWGFNNATGVLTQLGISAINCVVTQPVDKTQGTEGMITWLMNNADWPTIIGLGTTPNITGGRNITIPSTTAIIGRHTRGGNLGAVNLYALNYSQTDLGQFLQPGDVMLCTRLSGSHPNLMLGNGQVIGGGVELRGGVLHDTGKADCRQVTAAELQAVPIILNSGLYTIPDGYSIDLPGDWFFVFHIRHYTDYALQIAVHYFHNNDILRTRKLIANSWQSWKTVPLASVSGSTLNITL